ncbi:MAG: acylphosphatase [Fimbriimonadaceae bacterium]|nr:acylphosphatase [Fimbriimonadaceae bacterium]
MSKSVRVVIRGRVQGVGFRYHLAAVARREGLVGWCRNRPDGAVEAWLQGTPGAVSAVLGWCAVGPPAARVTALEQANVPADASLSEFSVRR